MLKLKGSENFAYVSYLCEILRKVSRKGIFMLIYVKNTTKSLSFLAEMFACTAYCVYLCSVFQEDIHKEISKDNVELKKRKVKRL